MSSIDTQQAIVPEKGLEKAFSYLTSMLVPGETLLKVAIQRRLFALTQRSFPPGFFLHSCSSTCMAHGLLYRRISTPVSAG